MPWRISSPRRRRSRQRPSTGWSARAASSTCAMPRRTRQSDPSASPPPTRTGRRARSCCFPPAGTASATGTPAYWRDAPYVTRAGAEWLLARKPSAVAFDFPQDYTIRLLLDGVMAPRHEHVTHDVLLAAGVTLIEYLVNTSEIAGPRTFLCAAPLKIANADGAPARVFAIEGLGL